MSGGNLVKFHSGAFDQGESRNGVGGVCLTTLIKMHTQRMHTASSSMNTGIWPYIGGLRSLGFLSKGLVL